MENEQSEKRVIARLRGIPLIILTATVLTLHGWISDENAIVFGWSSFYLRMITLPLLMALVMGSNPKTAPFNPTDSQDFWKVTTYSFIFFFSLVVITFVLFRLNKN